MCYKKMFNVHNLMPIQIQRFIDRPTNLYLKIKDITTINIVLIEISTSSVCTPVYRSSNYKLAFAIVLTKPVAFNCV